MEAPFVEIDQSNCRTSEGRIYRSNDTDVKLSSDSAAGDINNVILNANSLQIWPDGIAARIREKC